MPQDHSGTLKSPIGTIYLIVIHAPINIIDSISSIVLPLLSNLIWLLNSIVLSYSNDLIGLNKYNLLTSSSDYIKLAPWVATTAAFRNTLLLALGHRALRDLLRCTVRGSGEREGL